MTDLPDNDFTQRFIFDDSDTRGEMVSLELSYAEVLAKHAYPEPVAQLLGELMAAAALLVGTLKFDGLLILQARSEGPIPLLMIECSSERDIRGLARYEAEQIAPDATLADLMPDGSLTLTVDPTRASATRASSTWMAKPVGMLHQLLRHVAAGWHPHQAVRRWPPRAWPVAATTAGRPFEGRRRARRQLAALTALATTLTADELLSLDNETVLHRLYHEEQVRLFDVQRLRFRCSCSRERSANALVSLGLEDAQNLVIEHGGKIEIDCQFCNQRTCSMPPMSLNCSLARASRRRQIPVTKTVQRR
jgi:molecular chaperone Hsp33